MVSCVDTQSERGQMSILHPREDRFYRLFEDAAANVRRAAELLLAMLNDYTDVPAKARAIKDVEHKGDEITHTIYDQLNRIFVTPLDREDIAEIASRLDDVIDLIEASADDFVLFSVDAPTSHSVELAEIIVRSAIKIQDSVGLLSQRKARTEMRDYLTEINRLENEGDTVYRNAVQSLFQQPDAVRIIKWMQVYTHLERAIDSCEDVADELNGVLLKYA